MKTWMRIWLMVAMALGLSMGAMAQERGNKDDAKALADAAVEHVKKVGRDKAFKDFAADKATWNKKDLYVMVIDNGGSVLFHGGNDKLIGKNLIEMKDPNGKAFVKEWADLAKSKGTGWVDYDWAHPQTKKIEEKSTYIRKLADSEGSVGVGFYR